MIAITLSPSRLNSAIPLRITGAKRLTSTHGDNMREADRISTGRFAQVNHPQEIGQRFGRLLVLERVGTSKCGSIIFRCQCDCGNETRSWSTTLRDGTAQSCGCLNREHQIEAVTTHGHTSKHHPATREYNSWSSMHARCNSSTASGYKFYGGRGIKVCPQWSKFEKFLEDMGPRPKGTTLDRENVNGNYEKSNCRWADHETQVNNRRCNIFLEHDGKRMTVAQWCRKIGIKRAALLSRIDRGWPITKALTTPVKSTA